MPLWKILKFWNLICFFLLISCPQFAAAEKVKPLNPDCDVCPVVISYNSDETKNIIGIKGINFILDLKGIKAKPLKIDLRSVENTGFKTSKDNNCELLVFAYQHMIVINSISDGSSIKLKTEFKDLIKDKNRNSWSPEIQLTPSNEHDIEKTDRLDVAWSKMRQSSMYKLINNGDETWEQNLGKFLLMVLDTSLKNGAAP